MGDDEWSNSISKSMLRTRSVVIATVLVAVVALAIFAMVGMGTGAGNKKEIPKTNGTFTAVYYAKVLCASETAGPQSKITGRLTLVYRNNKLVHIEFNNKTLPLGILKYPHNVARGGELLLDLGAITNLRNDTNSGVSVQRANPSSHEESPYKAKSSLIITRRAVVSNLTVPGAGVIYFGEFNDIIDYDDVANVPYHFAISIMHPAATAMGCAGSYAAIFATLQDIK